MQEEARDDNYRILVVEDNPVDVELLRMALGRAGVGHDINVLRDGAVAFEWITSVAAKATAPTADLIVMDLNLPKRDGIEVLRAIAAVPALARIPIVVLTSSSSPRERDRLAGLPVTRHMVKPMGLDEFMQIGNELKALLTESVVHRTAEQANPPL